MPGGDGPRFFPWRARRGAQSEQDEREPDLTGDPASEEEATPEQPLAALQPVPDPEPEHGPPAEQESPEPAAAPADPQVVSLTARSLQVPQRWNVWELERLARELGGADAIRDEERSFLLMFLRESADADGVLPTSFDGVVREAFGDALDAVRA